MRKTPVGGWNGRIYMFTVQGGGLLRTLWLHCYRLCPAGFCCLLSRQELAVNEKA